MPNPPQPALAQQNQPQQPADDAPDRESRQETRNYEVNKRFSTCVQYQARE